MHPRRGQAVRDEVAFFQAVKVLLTKRDISSKKRTDEERDPAVRQIIGILDDDFLNAVRNLPERNLAVELLERLAVRNNDAGLDRPEIIA